jgi:hypothetical protein
MNVNIKTPIVLIAFNRPDTTKIVFDSIKEIKPKKLYVAIDGPRAHKSGEANLCKEVLEITKKVDWDCDVKYLVREENLGCKYGVSGAITWALENEDRIIVVEDDIVASPAFFSFAEKLLEKFKDDDRIGMISGNNYTPIAMDDDYLFSRYGHIWGWATWKRVWSKFDVEVPEIINAIDNNLENMSFVSSGEKRFYKKYFKKRASRIMNKTENAWGPQFRFFRDQNKLLSIVPKVNLASNIGVNSSRTNAVTKGNENYYPAETNFFLENHPLKVEKNSEYDKYHFNAHINKSSFFEKAMYKIGNFKN